MAPVGLSSISQSALTSSRLPIPPLAMTGMASALASSIEATMELARALTIPVIASGGIGNLDDVKALCEIELEGIAGAITGRANLRGNAGF